MERVPRQQYTKGFREQAVRLVQDQELPIPKTARRPAMSGKTLANWVFRARRGQLTTLGESRRPVTELEAEVSRLKRELAEARIERDILKKPPRPVRRRNCPVRMHDDAAPPVSLGPALSGPGGVLQRLLCLAHPPDLKARPGECAAGSGNPGGACAHSADIWTGAPPSGMRDDGFSAGVSRIKQLRKKLGLRCTQMHRFRATTNSNPGLPVADNRVTQISAATRPNEIWVADITYVPTTEEWLYLAGVKDLHTCEVVAMRRTPG